MLNFCWKYFLKKWKVCCALLKFYCILFIPKTCLHMHHKYKAVDEHWVDFRFEISIQTYFNGSIFDGNLKYHFGFCTMLDIKM